MKRILITWTSSWIGKAIAQYFLNTWNMVVWISRTNVLQNDLYKHYTCDLSEIEKRNDVFQKIVDSKVVFDVVICNAGVWAFWKFDSLSQKKNEEMMQVNLLSHIQLLHNIIWQIEEQWSLIFIWSVAWKKFMENWAIYQASKFGIRWFAWWLSKELSQSVHLLNPKIVDTLFHKDIKKYLHHGETKITDILTCIDNITTKKEIRFEIDL